MKYLLTIATLLCFYFSSAQLPDGTVAPDFTITDIDGNSHNLYSYLDLGIPVILDFSATWVGPAWSYAQSGALNDLYNNHGPSATGEVMVIMLEADDSTTAADLDGSGSNTIGDWISTIDYPIADNAQNLFSTYQNTFYPTIYTICPNHLTVQSGQLTYAEHLALIQAPSCDPLSAANNPALLEYTGELIACGSVDGEVQLFNFGQNDLTSVDITTTGCDNCPIVTNWSGTLATLESTPVAIPGIVITSDGDVTFSITTPNDNTADDTLVQYFTTTTSTTSEIHIDILTDCWPEETTWQLTDDLGTVVASGGPYAAAETVHNEVVTVGSGCYQFTYTDSYGDGMFGSQWNECAANGWVLVTSVNPDQTVFSTIYDYNGSFNVTSETRSMNSCGGLCPGCTDSTACNYNPGAAIDDGSCATGADCGCTDPTALNYSSIATFDDGSCTYPPANYGVVTDILGNVYDLDLIAAGGQKILFHFLADWNIFDEQIAPEINTIYTDYGCNLGDVFVVGINQQGDDLATVNYVIANQYLAPAVSLDGGAQALFDYFGIQAWPTVILADASFTLDENVYQGFDGATSGYFDSIAPGYSISPQPCEILGCMESGACNYDSTATQDDGSCDYSCLEPCLTIGNPLWSIFPTDIYPTETTIMEFGVPYGGELLFNAASVYTDPTNGNNFNIIQIELQSVSNLPAGIDVDLSASPVAGGSQICLPITGTPSQEGLFDGIFTYVITIDVFGVPLPLDATTTIHTFEVQPNLNGIPGCMYPFAPNYNSLATFDDGSCIAPDMSDACGEGTVWDPLLGQCVPDPEGCVQDLNYDNIVNTEDLLILLTAFSQTCD